MLGANTMASGTVAGLPSQKQCRDPPSWITFKQLCQVGQRIMGRARSSCPRPVLVSSAQLATPWDLTVQNRHAASDAKDLTRCRFELGHAAWFPTERFATRERLLPGAVGTDGCDRRPLGRFSRGVDSWDVGPRKLRWRVSEETLTTAEPLQFGVAS